LSEIVCDTISGIFFNNYISIIVNWYKITEKFVRNNNDIMFTKADKGSMTVALDKNDYREKMTNLLSDNNTYVIIKKDPTNGITDNLRQMLTGWKNKEFIHFHY